MKLKVGVTYEKTLDWPGSTVVTFLCLEECVAETARFKKKEPGYKFLVLAAEGVTHAINDYRPGEVRTYVAGAHFFTKVRRVGSDRR
jgi:hypothetical protein